MLETMTTGFDSGFGAASQDLYGTKNNVSPVSSQFNKVFAFVFLVVL